MKWEATKPAIENARRALPRLARKFFKAGTRAACEDASFRELHAFRLETKRFRYIVEIFAPLYGKELAPLIEGLKKVQLILGETNDSATVLKLEGVKANVQFVTWLKARRKAQRERVRKAWEEEFGDAGRWMEYLGKS
jgi:CHAD domain-containing protein